ncbi:hypothetical protein MICRO8M_20038 [Microbacterium sp. 8M]|nr:hypothetical protein MICRO8M_20038 [Microbacterium sp. 8M]
MPAGSGPNRASRSSTSSAARPSSTRTPRPTLSVCCAPPSTTAPCTPSRRSIRPSPRSSRRSSSEHRDRAEHERPLDRQRHPPRRRARDRIQAAQQGLPDLDRDPAAHRPRRRADRRVHEQEHLRHEDRGDRRDRAGGARSARAEADGGGRRDRRRAARAGRDGRGRARPRPRRRPVRLQSRRAQGHPEQPGGPARQDAEGHGPRAGHDQPAAALSGGDRLRRGVPDGGIDVRRDHGAERRGGEVHARRGAAARGDPGPGAAGGQGARQHRAGHGADPRTRGDRGGRPHRHRAEHGAGGARGAPGVVRRVLPVRVRAAGIAVRRSGRPRVAAGGHRIHDHADHDARDGALHPRDHLQRQPRGDDDPVVRAVLGAGGDAGAAVRRRGAVVGAAAVARDPARDLRGRHPRRREDLRELAAAHGRAGEARGGALRTLSDPGRRNHSRETATERRDCTTLLQSRRGVAVSRTREGDDGSGSRHPGIFTRMDR